MIKFVAAAARPRWPLRESVVRREHKIHGGGEFFTGGYVCDTLDCDRYVVEIYIYSLAHSTPRRGGPRRNFAKML